MNDPATQGRIQNRLSTSAFCCCVMLILSFSVGMPDSTAAESGSIHCSEGADVLTIREQRTAFNTAIAEKDIATVTAVLSEEVLLVTGTDSDVYLGREAQLDLWKQDFENADRMIYIRTPTCIDRSSEHPIALEHGEWRGVRTDALEGDVVFTGRYSAKWRQNGGVWQLETETYMTDCGGQHCEAPAPRSGTQQDESR